MTLVKRILLLLLIICSGITAYGQLSADFTANKTSGCGVLGGVTFTDISTGNPTSWAWDFGNGNTSTNQNPTVNFSNPGSYTIRLRIGSGSSSNTVTKTGFIQVFTNPESKLLAAPTSGCTPLTVNFNDNSTSVDGTINQWLWDFNDGSPASTIKNPTHTYSNVGVYNVSLTVTDDNGCSNTKIENGLIRPNPRPNAIISTNNSRSSCTAPYTVNFISNSTGSNLTYLWTFGDGNSSTQANPNHIYTAIGVYDVSLLVIDQAGCRDSSTQLGYITIKPVEANFDLVKDSICKGEAIQIINNSVNALTYNWNFGDGRTANTSSPSPVFLNAGTYQIRLSVSRGSNCVDEITKTLYVDSVKAQFDIDPLFACEDSTLITFTNQSYNSDSLQWILGNQLYTNIDTVTFFGSNGQFFDTLIAVSPIGCIDTATREDRSVFITEIELFTDEFGGCIPYTVDVYSNIKSSSPIVNFFWEFGDNGGLGTSTARDSVNYTFTTDTVFKLYVTILDSNGCEARDTINIGAGYPSNYTYTQLQDTVCASDSLTAVITYENQGMTLLGVSDSILGNVLSFNYLNDTLNVYNFRDTGITYVRIEHQFNGCISDTIVEVYVNGPIIRSIKDSINCTDKLTHYFSADAIDFNRFVWDFGDNSPLDSVNSEPVHIYQVDSTYTVTLTVFNDSNTCSYTLEKETIINRQFPSIFSDYVNMCVPFTFTVKPQLPNDTESFYWLVDGDTVRADSVIRRMDSAKVVSVQIVAVNNYGCIYNPSLNIIGYNFKASFVADTTRFCDPSDVIFTSTTTSNTFITSNFWNFGNVDTSSLNPDTTRYNIEGFYDVTLTSKDLNGCESTTTLSEYIRFYRNIPRFLTTNRNACVGEVIQFNNTSIGDSLSYFWEFGNGQTSTSVAPSTVYNTPGIYSVRLKSTTPIGCEREWVLTDYITIEASPIADFTSDTAISSCYPLPVNFTNTSTPLSTIIFNRWNFGDNTPISQFQDPFHNYTSVGIYDVTLIVGTNSGCKDTITKPAYIQTNGPEADINFYPDSICINESITFEAVNSSGVGNFIWDFGDGKSSTVSPIKHRYTDKTGPTYISLILSDSSGGCVVGLKDTVYIKEMIALIGVNDTNGCEPLVVNFSDNSLNVSNSLWKLYDGTSTGQTSFTKTLSSGTYPVQLITEGLGCFDTAEIVLSVYSNPSIQLSSDSAICEGDSLQLLGSGAQFYLWTPPRGLTNPTIPNPIASPNTTTNYQLTITDTNNCKAADSLLLTVYNRPFIDLESDSLLYLGEEMNLVRMNNQVNVTYFWTPSKGLSCGDCPFPIARPLESTRYYLTATDENGCFTLKDSIYIDVFDGFSVELPTAFSPNGDGNNDIIFLKGWGIKTLLTFQIYNRWGELVFETTDLTMGWDGTYKGQPQVMDTYIYIAKALGYNDQVIEKKGNITLLR